MANESTGERKKRELREDQQRCRDAAAEFRRRITAGRYTGLTMGASDDLDHFAAVLDSAARELESMPPGTRSDVMAAARWLVPDETKRPGPVSPLSSGDGV